MGFAAAIARMNRGVADHLADALLTCEWGSVPVVFREAGDLDPQVLLGDGGQRTIWLAEAMAVDFDPLPEVGATVQVNEIEYRIASLRILDGWLSLSLWRVRE